MNEPSTPHEIELAPQLQDSLEYALLNPLDASPLQLWDAIAQWLAQQDVELTLDQQMTFMADVFSQIAEIYFQRADRLFNRWELDHAPPSVVEEAELEPVLDDDMISHLFRQSLDLNLEKLKNPKPQQRRKPYSIAGEVSKENVLAFVDQVEQERVKAIAHQENISQWQSELSNWAMKQNKDQFNLLEFTAIMPLLQAWIALLLSPQWRWEHAYCPQTDADEDFYSPKKISVSISPDWSNTDKDSY